MSLSLNPKNTSCKHALTIGDRPQTSFPLPIMVVTMVTAVGWASADLTWISRFHFVNTWRKVLVIVLKTEDIVVLVTIVLNIIVIYCLFV